MENASDQILKNHFSKYLEDDLHLGFWPSFIGQEKCSPLKPVTYHMHEEQYTFHFIFSGTGYIFHGDSVVKLQANDVFFLPPDEKGRNAAAGYYPDKDDPWEYVWFNFVGKPSENLAKCAKLSFENNYYSVQNPAVLRQQLTEMFNVARDTAKRNASYYLPYIMRFFAEIADERKISNTTTATEKEKRVKFILDYIEHNYSAPDFSIRDIAEKMFYTTSYVSRIFNEITGKTPIEYVTSLRMLKAQDMLRSKNYNISQIAYAVGYNSPFYFSKQFKKYFGYSPSRFGE